MTSIANVSFDRKRLMIQQAIFSGQPFQDANFFIDWISFGIFSFEPVFFAQSATDLIQAAFHFHKVRESMLMYSPV